MTQNFEWHLNFCYLQKMEIDLKHLNLFSIADLKDWRENAIT